MEAPIDRRSVGRMGQNEMEEVMQEKAERSKNEEIILDKLGGWVWYGLVATSISLLLCKCLNIHQYVGLSHLLLLIETIGN